MSFQTSQDWLDASRLDKRVQLQRRTLSQAVNGEQIETWTTIRTLWAAVGAAKGMEVSQAGGRFADARIEIRIRYQPDIYITRGEHRFVVNEEQWRALGYSWEEAMGTWEDRALNILDVSNPNSQNTFLRILCQDWAV
jgi:SPP1 family predicted phage head-tail adaptor